MRGGGGHGGEPPEPPLDPPLHCPIFREFIVCLLFTSRFLGYLENLGIMLLDIDNYIW